MDWPTGIIAASAVAQALAAIVALGIAVSVPIWQQKRAELKVERERRLKAQCLATAICFDLHDIKVSLAKMNLTAVGGALGAAAPGAWVPEYLSAKVEIPASLTSSVDQVYLLGNPAGPTLLRLSAVLNNYNQAVDREANSAFTNPTNGATKHWNILQGLIRDVEGVLDDALKQIQPIADGKFGEAEGVKQK